MATVRADARWLFGPATDLVFGCGLAYSVLFLLQVFAGPQMREVFPLEYQPLLAVMLGMPHYGATLVRVYERREDRRKYALFSVWATLLLAALFLAGLHLASVGSLLVTVYFTWSPWHYSGQNYGIGLMFLRRRGVPVTPLLKRLIYASFLLSFALIVLTLHGADPSASYAPGSYTGTAYRFVSLEIPAGLADGLFVACGAAYLATLVAAGALLLRSAPLRALGPTAAIVGTQALWFGAPALARQFGWLSGVDPFAPSQQAYSFIWIAMGHFVQYLWITSYYATASERGATGAAPYLRFLGKAVLAGVAVWVVPQLLFSPRGFGSVPYDYGLGILTAALVNIHHFILDGAIWKLRDGPIARVLLRSEPVERAYQPVGEGRRGGWRRPATVFAGALVVVVVLAAELETLAYRGAQRRGDLEASRAALERLRWLGRESPRQHMGLAKLSLSAGDEAQARASLERGIELYPTAEGWKALAGLHAGKGRPKLALEAYREALVLDPEDAQALFGAGASLLRLGEPEQAEELLERAAERAQGRKEIARLLERARARSAQRSAGGSAPPAETAPGPALP
jgi:tetratricopeptide (TPR) repeat protein